MEKVIKIFKEIWKNKWFQKFLRLCLSVIILFSITVIVFMYQKIPFKGIINSIFTFLFFIGVIYFVLSTISWEKGEEKTNYVRVQTQSFSGDLSKTQKTPLEKKYEEINGKIEIWKKTFSNYKQFSEAPVAYYGDDIEQNITHEFKKMKSDVNRLAETYTKHRELIEFAHEIAVFDRDSDQAGQYNILLIQMDKDELSKLQNEKYIQSEQKKSLSTEYDRKATNLRYNNNAYIWSFIGLSTVFVILLSILYIWHPLPSSGELLPFLLTKTTISITFTMVLFWVARFFNRRIHENVHLIEEYEHRALLLYTLDVLTNKALNNEHKRNILDKILISLTENPTECLNRKKADKIPNEFIELVKSISSIKPVVPLKTDEK